MRIEPALAFDPDAAPLAHQRPLLSDWEPPAAVLSVQLMGLADVALLAGGELLLRREPAKYKQLILLGTLFRLRYNLVTPLFDNARDSP